MNRQREVEAPWRALYRTEAWRRLRAVVLAEQPLCGDCAPRVVVASEVHHVVAHRGDERLFWDRSNLTGLCRACHSRRTQRGE